MSLEDEEDATELSKETSKVLTGYVDAQGKKAIDPGRMVCLHEL